MPPAPSTVHLEMGITRADFLRGLHRLANEMESFSEVGESEWQLCAASACIGVRFHELPPRRAGSMALPRARVTLHMAALDEKARAAFLARFRRVFQRAGG